jgi:hypothetical protein
VIEWSRVPPPPARMIPLRECPAASVKKWTVFCSSSYI